MMHKDFYDPDVTVFAKCYVCGAAVRFGAAQCPHCETELDQERLLPNAFNHYVITRAVSAANAIRTFDFAVYLSTLVALMRLALDFPLWLNLMTSLTWLGVLGAVLYWFWRHGRWESDDADYQAARAEMKKSLWLWLAANFFNFVVIFIKLAGKAA